MAIRHRLALLAALAAAIAPAGVARAAVPNGFAGMTRVPFAVPSGFSDGTDDQVGVADGFSDGTDAAQPQGFSDGTDGFSDGTDCRVASAAFTAR